jgi:hypothetical protein
MRTSYDSSARRLSSWLMVVLGVVAYVGLLYGLTLLPLQFEVPLPFWGIAVVPPIVYGLLVPLLVRWPSPLRWLMGTALLSGLHVLLTFARAPISAFLDPTLAGRPLPWVVPPPLPELVGLILLLVPLRDLLRARPRSARERLAAGRSTASARARVVTRPVQSSPMEGRVPADGPVPVRVEVAPEPQAQAVPAVPVLLPVTTTVSAVETESGDEIRRRRAAARAERRREMESLRPAPRRSNTVLRIALDRVMDQLPPGTFLAPEDEVAASLRDPGHLLIPGDLVVTQLSEGVARVAWNDIVEQFPSHLIGLGRDEITEHLGDGLRLPLDEVVGQLPHDLFVADTPEIEVPGLDRIPVPFHPLDDAGPYASAAPLAPPARPTTSEPEAPRISPAVAPVSSPVPSRPAPAGVRAPEPPSYVDEPGVAASASKTIEMAMPAPIEAAPPVVPSAKIDTPEVARPMVPAVAPAMVTPPDPVAASATEPASAPVPELREATVRISLERLTPEISAEAFSQPLDQVAARMRAPGALLVPLSSVLPQLGEGMIRVGWDVVAAQFPRDLMAVSDSEMVARLPQGLQLPLDEIIRQLSPDLFANTGPAADVSGLESFPAPFQPLLSDPAPESQPAASSASVAAAVPEPAVPTVAATREPVTPSAMPDLERPQPSETSSALTPPAPEPAPATPLVIESFVRTDYTMPTEKASEAVADVLPLEGAVPAHLETSRTLMAEPAAAEDSARPVPPAPIVEPEREVTPAPIATPAPILTPEPVVWSEPSPLERAADVVPEPMGVPTATPQPGRASGWTASEPASTAPAPVEPVHSEPKHRWDDLAAAEAGSPSHGLDPSSSARLRQIVGLLAPIASFEATVQPMEGVSVYALTAPVVSAEIAVAATGLALPLLTDRRSPWPIDQFTLRGAETALVLTPLGNERSPVLATAAARGGALALLEILCRRAVDPDRRPPDPTPSSGSDRRRSLVAVAMPPAATRQASSLTAFGAVTASALRDPEGEATFYFFLPPDLDVPAVGSFAQDLQAVMRKAAGSGAVFRSAVLRSGRTIVVIQPEEVGHGRSIVVVAGGEVTRPGLAYRQVERAIATLAQA